MSRSIRKEAQKRARRYYTDYGVLGAKVLALSAMYVRYGEFRRLDDLGPQAILNAIRGLWPQLERSDMLAMDRTSGLGLIRDTDSSLAKDLPWRRAFARNGWLCPYLHLLTRPDILQLLAESGYVALLRPWWECLPLDRSTVSALRVALSSWQPKRDNMNIFFDFISYYIDVSHR